MRCAWNALVRILPPWLGQEINPIYKDELQELRLRKEKPPELICRSGSSWLKTPVTQEDLHFCVNTASKYSPWAAQSMAKGYLTAPGGHRIGICGEGIWKAGENTGIKNISSLCIRVARDFPGIGAALAPLDGSILILGSPGCGKTTLLRDLVREISKSRQTAVVDERGELFPPEAGFDRGRSLDVLTGCGKPEGIEMLTRTMGPAVIAVDEVTASGDCEALLHAGWCGVQLIATAHASTISELRKRPVYRPLTESHLFDYVVILRRDKSWYYERMDERCFTGSVRC